MIQIAGAAVLSLALPKAALSAGKVQATNVGSYLPPAAEAGFSQFKPTDTQTPVKIFSRICHSPFHGSTVRFAQIVLAWPVTCPD